MATAFVPGLAVSPRSTLRRIRELPVRGEILVTLGQAVTADTIVARANLPGELHILRVAEKLGVEPFEVMKGLRVGIGDEVRMGDIICEHAGFFGIFKIRFVSSVSGKIELITERTGHIGVRGASKPVTVDAYIAGQVAEIHPGKGVTIATEAVWVQGIFGVGGERRGRLYGLPTRDDQAILPSDLPREARGMILFGGTRPSYETLKLAAERGAVGLIVGSVDDRALSEFLGYDIGIALTGDEDIPMTLVVTEGFGTIALNPRIRALLKRCEGKIASINGATQVRAGAVRPEIIVCDPLAPDGTGASRSDHGLCVGATVRIIRVPYFGARAVVSSLPNQAEMIETGAFARVLRAKLEDGSEVTVPRANVELAE